MEVLPEMLEKMVGWFRQSLSPDAAARSAAEQSLSAAADTQGFAVALLALASSPRHGLEDRLAPSVYFKNLLRHRWPNHLPANDCSVVKVNIFRVLLEAPPIIQAHLCDALCVASTYDFPANWGSLLPSIISSLANARSAGDVPAIKLLLTLTLSIFSRFRRASDCEALRADLKYCHEIFATPFGTLMAYIEDRRLRDCLDLCYQIILSLVMADVPKDLICNWMTKLRPLSPKDEVQYIFDKFVVPFLHSCDKDEQLFEQNWMEYIRCDMLDSDILYDDCLRLASMHREQLVAAVSSYLQQILALYEADPVNNWKEKVAAINLAIAVTEKYATDEDTVIIDTDKFYTDVILPELQDPDWQSKPILKAALLRFLDSWKYDLFHSPRTIELVPSVIQFLSHESIVVHSYAAIFISNILNERVSVTLLPVLNVSGEAARHSSADIDPFLPQIVGRLCNALSPGSCKNPYLMKCMMRVLGFFNIGKKYPELEAPTHCGVSGTELIEITAHLVGILMEVCNEPSYPYSNALFNDASYPCSEPSFPDNQKFNYYLFEALIAVIRRAGEKGQTLLPVLEARLFPVLQRILVEDISDFWPYAFQIISRLVNLSQPPLSQNYMQLFDVLQITATWDRPACVPALVRLLRAFLQKIPNELNQEGWLSKILLILQRLFSCSSTKDSAFYMLKTLVENVGFHIMSPYLTGICSYLLTQLQTRPPANFLKSFIVFMSLVVIRYGPAVLVSSVNTDHANANCFSEIIKCFWIPHLKTFTNYLDIKLTAVASTKLLCESPVLLDPAASRLWGSLLDGLVSMFFNRPHRCLKCIDRDDSAAPVDDRLPFAGKIEDDFLKEVIDPIELMVTSLASISAENPGKFGPIVELYMNQDNRKHLHDFCRFYNTNIV